MPTKKETTAVTGGSLKERLLGIMAKVGFIEKDKRNEFHKYAYASEEAIKKTLQPLLVDARVLFGFTITAVQPVGDRVFIQGEASFTDVDSDDRLVVPFAGAGQDSGDKALYKAITGAIKYALTSAFLIQTGSDPETDVADQRPVYNAPVASAPRQQVSSQAPVSAPQANGPATTNYPASEAQKGLIRRLCAQKGKPLPTEEWFAALQSPVASSSIENLMRAPSVAAAPAAPAGDSAVIQID